MGWHDNKSLEDQGRILQLEKLLEEVATIASYHISQEGYNPFTKGITVATEILDLVEPAIQCSQCFCVGYHKMDCSLQPDKQVVLTANPTEG